jgi:hypothetical protein
MPQAHWRRLKSNRRPDIYSVLLLLVPVLAWGQVMPNPISEWGYSFGVQRYAEPSMQMAGPETGVHWRSYSLANLGHANIEVDALIGRQKYMSDSSGHLNNVPNVETRWRILWPVHRWPNMSYGLALHTHTNDFEGTTSTGNGGYDRLSTQLWLPFRWRDNGQNWRALGPAKTVTLDAGVLLLGQQVSKLSQANPNKYTDIHNTQHTGFYIQTKADYSTGSGIYSPFIRWTWVDDSDKVNGLRSGFQDFYEPLNRRLQIGVEWHYSR